MGDTPAGQIGSKQAGQEGGPRGGRGAAGPDSQRAPGTGADPADGNSPGLALPAQSLPDVPALPGLTEHAQGRAARSADAQAVAVTPARYGRPGGPGIGADLPEAAPPPGLSAWQLLDHRWQAAGIAWAGDGARGAPAAAGDRPAAVPAPPGTPVPAGRGTGHAGTHPAGGEPPRWPGGDPGGGDDPQLDGADWDLAGDVGQGPPGGLPAQPRPGFPGAPAGQPPAAPVTGRQAGGRHAAPRRTSSRRPAPRTSSRRRAAVSCAVTLCALVTAAVLALALLPGRNPGTGRLSAGQPGRQAAAPAALSALTYPGQQRRDVFQAIDRIVASGSTVVAMGSQTTGGVVRQQFFVSANAGASWRLAPVRNPGGGQAPVGYPAVRLAGGPGGWLAVGPHAIWTSPDGLSWTLSATHGIAPVLPGDQMWVLNSTSGGFLAAGVTGSGHGAAQAVIWISRNGLTWQRKTPAQLRLAGRGQRVQSISYITSRGADTVMSGWVVSGRKSYSATWLSTDGGAAWTPVSVPAGHGAGTVITGLGSDGSGLIAIRAGRSASGAGDGVAYFSAEGRAWHYAATITSAGGWRPSLVKGSNDGFVVTGTSATGQILAYTSTGAGTSWQPTAPLGDAASETLGGATVDPAGTVIAVGSAVASNTGQQPVFLEATVGDPIERQITLTGIPGAVVPEVAVHGLAASGGQQVAVGSADGFPAVWREAAGGRWALVTSLAQVSGPHLSALTTVAHGSGGWLAAGAPDPVVLTSSAGTRWRQAGPITTDLAGASAVAAAAGRAGYVIAGKIAGAGGACETEVWWSSDLRSWTRAGGVSDGGGCSQVIAVAAGPHGFVAAGSRDGEPAVWTSSSGRGWTAAVLPAPAGSTGAVLQKVAIDGSHVAALGQETTSAGDVPFAEVSADGGVTWTQVPFSAPGPGAVFTALTADAGGFTAAAQFGSPGQQQAGIWTTPGGTSWTRAPASGLTGPGSGGAYQVDALAAAGQVVTGVASITTQQSQRILAATLPGRDRARPARPAGGTSAG